MNFDIAVIGASSAGLFAAEKLALAGRRVGVFEAQADLQPARRTLIITPELRRFLPSLPDPAVLHEIQVMAVASRRASAQIELGTPDLIVERSLLTQDLLERARRAGVHIELDFRFRGIQPHPRGAALLFRNGREDQPVTARTVIGADGVTSEVARAAGIPLPPRVPILQAEVGLPPDWDPGLTQVWFQVDRTRYFYWLIPESPTRGVAGLVGDHRQRTDVLLGQFLDQHGLQPLAFQGAQVAMHHPRLKPWTRMGAADILLIGDAAGQVKVTTVVGTVSGFWGAEAAVRSILQGRPYRQELGGLKRELDVHWLIRLLLERLDNQGYDRLVRLLNPAVMGFLARHNRDAMADVFWKLALLQPRLLGLGLQMVFPQFPSPRSRETGPVSEAE